MKSLCVCSAAFAFLAVHAHVTYVTLSNARQRFQRE